MWLLTRRGTEDRGEIMALTTPSFQLFDNLHHELVADPDQQTIKGKVESSIRGDKWLMVDGLITAMAVCTCHLLLRPRRRSWRTHTTSSMKAPRRLIRLVTLSVLKQLESTCQFQNMDP
jgi:hypothetical protein